MKTLYLIRHGQAENKGNGPDYDRNLDNEGRKEVARTANAMVERKIVPTLILSSPAHRALQTAEIVAKIVGYKTKDIVLEGDIYYTDTQKLLEVLHQQPNSVESIMLAGHNPAISALASILSSNFIQSIPTGGFVAFETDSLSWNQFEKGKTKFLFNIYP